MSRAPKREGFDAPIPTWTLIQPVQELMARHKYDEAMSRFQRILTDSAPRIQRHPEEIGAFTNLVQSLPQGRQEERLQLMRSIIATLDGVRPADHPRVARALSQFVGTAMHAGLNAAEITRLLERQERILVASKGEDSPALNDVSRQRAGFLAFRGDHSEAAVEMKRALKRTEAASGAKSQPALQIMREVINSLQATNESWPEEESLRLAVIERSGQSAGLGGNVAHDMSSLATRYFAVGQRENAVAWMDKAIDLARRNPQMTPMVQGFQHQRAHFANEQVQPSAGGSPFFGAASGRWFNGVGASGVAGSRLGYPMPGVIGSPMAMPAPPPPPPPPPPK